jgi:hypothetical protein
VVGSQPSAHVETVDVGERQVEQYQCGASGVDGIECGLAGRDVEDIELFGAQDADQWLADPFVVLDEEYRGLIHVQVIGTSGRILDLFDR